MSNTFKKIVVAFTTVTTILTMSGVVLLAPISVSAATVVDGDLIRNPNAEGMAQFDIYIAKMVGSKKFKRLILSPHVFESYAHFDKNGNGTPWDDVIDVDQATMDSLTLSELVRADGDTKVYKLVATPGSDSGTKEWLNMTAEEFGASYDWDSIYTINTTDRDAYSAGGDITTGEEGTTGEVTTSTGTLTVSLAADTPAAAFALMNSTRVPFTKVNFTATGGDVIITSMKVERTGSPATDAAFSGVNVLKPNGDLLSSSYKTLNSEHQVTFTEDIAITSGTTESYILVGKMLDASTYAGETPTLSLAEVNLSGDATLNASLPIAGNAMTINGTVNIADLTLNESPDVGTATEEVGTIGQNFAHVKMTNSASNADIQIESVKFNNVGSADDADVENMQLVYYNTGEVLATADMVNNYIYFDLSGCGSTCTIGKGKNKTFSLKGDIIGGSARTLDFDIKKVEHVVAKDLLNNVYITPSGTIDYGNIITISRGKLNVNKTNTVQAGNISDDKSEVELGSWNFNVKGESITVSTIKFDIEITDNAGSTFDCEDFTNLVLTNKTTGDTLTGGTDGAEDSSGSNDGYVSFSDSFTLPIGDNEIIMTGTINSTPSASDTVQIGVDFTSASTDNLDATGDVTGEAIALSATAASCYATPYGTEIDANLLTFKDLALAVTTLSQPAARTIAAGTSDVQYSTVTFDASDSSEAIKVTQFKFTIVSDTTAKANELQNIRFVVDGTELTETKNGSETDASDQSEQITVSLTGSDQFVVPKGGSVTMKIYADLSSGATATGTHRIQISSATSDTVTSIGNVSTSDVTETYASATANDVTVGTAGGAVEVSLTSGNPNVARLFAAGLKGVSLASFKFYATSTEDVELDYIYLTQVVAGDGEVASSSYKDYDRIYFEDENGVEVATVNPTSTFPKLDFADNAFVVDIDDTNGEILTLKADLAAISTSANGVAGHYLGYKINNAVDVVAKGDLTGGGTQEFLSSGSAPTGKTHYVYKGYPEFAKVPLTANLANGTNDLYKFTVTAQGGDIALYGFNFGFVTTGCNVTSMYVYEVIGSTETVMNDTAGSCLASNCVWRTVGSDWTTNFPGYEVNIDASDTRTFIVRGEVTGAAAGDAVQTVVGGDSAHTTNPGDTLMGTAAEIDADANDSFIWSDKSVGAHTYGTDDWTNGYLVPGLPSSSSSAQTLSL